MIQTITANLLMKKFLIFSVLILMAGCTSIDKTSVRTKLLKEHVITGQIIPGSVSFSNVNKKSDFDRKPGIYLITSQTDYDYYFYLQDKPEGKSRKIDFTNRICILAIVEPIEYTNIEFHELIDGTDRMYHAYFLVDRKPVENIDETLAYCLVDMPKVYGELNIDYIYLRENLYTGYVIEEAGKQTGYVFER